MSWHCRERPRGQIRERDRGNVHSEAAALLHIGSRGSGSEGSEITPALLPIPSSFGLGTEPLLLTGFRVSMDDEADGTGVVTVLEQYK